MSLIKQLHLILLFLLPVLPQISSAQIVIGKEDDSSWVTKELPSQELAKKKFTLKRRLTQNLLTRFNAYYNAHTRMETILSDVAKIHQDNYDSLLTLYPHTPADFNALSSNLDSVIFDAGYGVGIHDPRSKWIDNLYLLAGKAYYFKQDFSKAIKTFRYIIKYKGAKDAENSPAVIGSRGSTSKEQISVATVEKKKLFYHRPSRNDAFIWLIKSYIDSGAYDLAGTLINTLQADPVFPDRLQADLMAAKTGFYFSQQLQDKGMPVLEKAIAKETNKTLKARWNFILGQYFQQNKDWEKALHYYELARQLRPRPLMRFYAELNIIDVHIRQNPGNYSSGMEDMLAMARREKYELYRSIIYYHLAKTARSFGHPDEAIAFLKTGLLYNTENGSQKLKNYYLLANTLYTTGRYGPSLLYYDSTAAFMDETFDFHDEVTTRQNALSSLMFQRNIVYRQDSLQYLASMPSADLQALLRQIVKDSIRARKKRNLFIDEPALSKKGTSTPGQEDGRLTGKNDSGNQPTWYFYNNTLKAKGFSMFRSKWGKRPLADNWRTGTTASPAPALAANKPPDVQPDSTRLQPSEANNDSLSNGVKALLAPIPLTKEQMKKSNDSVMNALYVEAGIFADRLNNDTAALNTLATLQSRFPDNPFLAATYYRLYQINKKLNNSSLSAHYKQLLSEKFPTSKYNAALVKPLQPVRSYAERTTTQLYESAYMQYLDGNYDAVKVLKDSALLVDPNNDQKARFDLLAAMALIKQQPSGNAGKAALQQVIKDNDNDTAITVQAKSILNALDHKDELIEHLVHLQLPEQGEPSKAMTYNQPEANLTRSDTISSKTPVVNPLADTHTQPEVKDSAASVPSPQPAPVPKPVAPPVTPYKVNQKDSYFVVLSFNHTDTKIINECLEKFAAYNEKKHAGQGIEVSSYLINKQVILIFRLFPGELPALQYYNEIKKYAPGQIIPDVPPAYYNLFIISRDNFILLNSTKDFAGYLKFFSQNYR